MKIGIEEENHAFTPNPNDEQFCNGCGLLLVDHGDEPKTEQGQRSDRYGFVVFTGRHKIMDYYKADGQQIATADNEDAARTIVRALNYYRNGDQMRAALEAITRIAGNLSDEAVEAVGGVNDARSRALMVVTARQIAQNALRSTTPE